MNITITLQPGAIVINQQSAELPEIRDALVALREKVDTLVPDTAQVERIRERMQANTDTLAQAVAEVAGAPDTPKE